MSNVLKQNASALHHKLDHLPMMQQLMSPHLTMAEYGHCMRTLGEWFMAVETRFFHAWPGHLNILAKAPLIAKDLKAIGQSAPIQAAELRPIPSLNADFALGVLYVCEGSTLGGQVLAPRVCRSLGRDDIANYYQCYGAQTFGHWQCVMSFINEALVNENRQKDILNGARWAFSSLIAFVETTECDTYNRDSKQCLSA
jgi:heme oxygenase